MKVGKERRKRKEQPNFQNGKEKLRIQRRKEQEIK